MNCTVGSPTVQGGAPPCYVPSDPILLYMTAEKCKSFRSMRSFAAVSHGGQAGAAAYIPGQKSRARRNGIKRVVHTERPKSGCFSGAGPRVGAEGGVDGKFCRLWPSYFGTIYSLR